MNSLNFFKSSSSFSQYLAFGHTLFSNKRLLTIGAIALASLSLFVYKNSAYSSTPTIPQKTKLFCVLYDTGETKSLLPVLQKLDSEGKDFRVLVMGTAETLVKPEMLKGKRLTLKDFGIATVVDTTTPRTLDLSEIEIKKLSQVNPQVVLVGVASRIQEQVLELFSNATTVAFVDNIDYDPKQESFKTVEKVQAAAKHVFVPSSHTLNCFDTSTHGQYYVVGKPSLEVWENEIAEARKKRSEILETLHFTNDRPIVTFIGGYGPGYEVIDPLFDACEEILKNHEFQVIRQHHPKVAPQIIDTSKALAVSEYVVGYNSSVILDCALIGIRSLFLIPDNPKTQFQHFAIKQNLIPKVTDCGKLLQKIQSKNAVPNIRGGVGIPLDATNNIIKNLNQWM